MPNMLGSKFMKSFPEGGDCPEILDLAIANHAATQYGRMNSKPQHPRVVAACCSQVDLSRAQMVRDLGALFKISVRGARLSDEGIASLSYPFAHLGDPKPGFLEVVVHTCTEGGICRGAVLDMLEKPEGNIVQIQNKDALDMLTLGRAIPGLRRIEMPATELIPPADREHAESRMRKILHGSETIKSLLSQGDLIVGEAHYDTKTGKVRWSAFWTSSAPGNDVPRGLFNAIVAGRLTCESDLEGFHPGLKSLNALVLGNNTFTQNFELPMPTEVVVFSCADSRLSPVIMKTPHGLVEWVQNAGNVINPKTLRGLRVALRSAADNVRKRTVTRATDPEGYQRRAVLMVLSHSRCGAVGATLQHLRGCHDDHGHSDSPDPAAPIVQALSHRFSEYTKSYPAGSDADPLFIQAAQANAVGACLDILKAPGEDGDLIRAMVEKDELIIVPSWYLLTTGLIQMLPPIDAQSALSRFPTAANL